MYFLRIIVLSFLILETFGRPTHVLQDYDKDSRDSSYRDSDSEASDDYQHNDQKQFADDPASKADGDENGPGTNEEVDHARSDKDYLENVERQTDSGRLLHDNVNNDVKRTATYGAGEIIFQNDKPRNTESNEYIEDETARPIHNDRLLKPYHAVHIYDRDSLVRDRREIKNSNLNDPIGTEEISTQKNELSANEDEETAIRRHVKKLSKEELDELLHSLSEDKRALLKNIIDNCQQEYDSINKREITKKAGANEENSFVGNEQPDASKIQGGAANLEADSSMAPNFEKQDNTKKEDAESTFSKSTESSSSSEKPNYKINVLDNIAGKTPVTSDNTDNLVSSETQSIISSSPDSEKDTSKKENKREINSNSATHPKSVEEEEANLKSSDKQDLYCSENEAISQLWNDESSLYNDNKYKREVCSDDMDSIKSLEESFPNADNSNEVQIESDMEPLVRVKRDKERIVKKRDDNVVSNLKVPYFSSALENNEEESDEGGEFQDDGFFDRGANLATAGQLTKRGIDTSKGSGDNKIKYCQNSQQYLINKNKPEGDTASLGSDTDVVLSGIEGVDDNIMLNSVARFRRTGKHFDDSNIEGEDNKLSHENNQRFSSQNENNENSEEYNNGARYQENDAFGSLPRNYEHDLGRFKRIRRLKHEINEPATK